MNIQCTYGWFGDLYNLYSLTDLRKLSKLLNIFPIYNHNDSLSSNITIIQQYILSYPNVELIESPYELLDIKVPIYNFYPKDISGVTIFYRTSNIPAKLLLSTGDLWNNHIYHTLNLIMDYFKIPPHFLMDIYTNEFIININQPINPTVENWIYLDEELPLKLPNSNGMIIHNNPNTFLKTQGYKKPIPFQHGILKIISHHIISLPYSSVENCQNINEAITKYYSPSTSTYYKDIYREINNILKGDDVSSNNITFKHLKIFINQINILKTNILETVKNVKISCHLYGIYQNQRCFVKFIHSSDMIIHKNELCILYYLKTHKISIQQWPVDKIIIYNISKIGNNISTFNPSAYYGKRYYDNLVTLLKTI